MMKNDIQRRKVKNAVSMVILLFGMFSGAGHAQNVTADFTYVQDCATVTFTNESGATGGITIIDQLWDFGDGITSTEWSPVHVFSVGDDYTVTLTIFHDGPGGQEVTSQVVSVWAPTANFTSSEECQGVPTLFTSTAEAPNSEIVSWEWDFTGDGVTDATGETASWTFPDQGPHPVTHTVINALGCADEKTENANVKPNPEADFSFTVVCAGNPTSFEDETDPQVGTIQNWAWDFDNDGNPDASTETAEYTFPAGGMYPVSLWVETNQGCSDEVVKMVQVYLLPEASFVTDPGCPLEETAFTDASLEGDAGIDNWLWNFGDGSPAANEQNPVHTYLVNGTFDVQLTVTDDNGCQDDTIQELVQQKPVADFSADMVCFGEPTSFTDNSTFEPGYDVAAWQWDFGDGIGTSGLQDPQYTYPAHGEYEAELIVFNALLCSDTAVQTVLVDTLPVASFSAAPACVGLPTCFTDESVANASSIESWQWDFGDFNNSSLQNPCHTYLASGSYEVTLTVVNSDGCVSQPFVQTIFVSMAPDVDFSFDDVCFGDTTFFENLTDTFGYQIAFLEWNFGDPSSPGNTSGEFNPFHVYSTPGTYDVKLVVENEYGCIDSAIHLVTIDSLPTAFFTMTDTISVGVEFGITDLSEPHGSPIFTWYWDFGDGNTGTNINPVTHEYNETGDYVVCLTVTDFNGCAHQYCDTIYVAGRPTADFDYASDVSLETYFTDESQPGYSIIDWYWNFGDPTTTLDTVSGTPEPTWQYATEGWYSVFLEVEDSYGGVHDTTKLIFAGNAVVPEFEQYGQCVGDTTVFLDYSYSPIASTFETWYWDFGDGSDTTYSEKADTILHHYQFPGIYPVKLAVSATVNGFFMTDTLMNLVSIFESPAARIDTTGLNVCLGTIIQFQDATPAILDPIVDWIWTFDTDAGDSAFIQNPEFLYADTGAYNVKMAITTEQGCSSIDSVYAHVNVSPNFSFIIENNCVNSPTQFIPQYDSTSITITKWNWNFGDELSPSNTSTLAKPTHVYDRVAEYTITMKMEAFGCAGEAQETILVYPIPYSQFSLEPDFGGVQGRTKFTNSSIYATSYLWDFGNGNTSTVPDPVEVYEYDSTYTITLISYNEYFCADTSRSELTVFFKGLYFPTAFSPNNPNIEISVFQPKGINLKEYLVQVFDMRGNLMWESDKVDEAGTPVESWDGYYNGRIMPQGTYIWKAAAKFRDGSVWEGQSFDGTSPQTNGVVTIVR